MFNVASSLSGGSAMLGEVSMYMQPTDRFPVRKENTTCNVVHISYFGKFRYGPISWNGIMLMIYYEFIGLVPQADSICSLSQYVYMHISNNY